MKDYANINIHGFRQGKNFNIGDTPHFGFYFGKCTATDVPSLLPTLFRKCILRQTFVFP